MIASLCVLFFPFDWIIGDLDWQSFYITVGIAVALLATGAALYFQKRGEYPDKFRAKIKKLTIIIGIAIAGIFVAALIVGVALGISSALNALAPTTHTSSIDADLLETRVLDWINKHRVKSDIGGINLDDALVQLAAVRNTEIARAPPDERESVSEKDVTEIAKREGLDCTDGDGNIIPIMEYTMVIPHGEFRKMESFVDYSMKYLTNHEDGRPRDMIFASNATRTGVNAIVTDEHLFVTQNFC